MTAEEVKHKLRLLNISQAELARRWKKSESAVSLCINRKMKSAEIEEKLAALLKIEVEELRPKPEDNLRELERIREQVDRIIKNAPRQS